jgi:hypothetical protein
MQGDLRRRFIVLVHRGSKFEVMSSSQVVDGVAIGILLEKVRKSGYDGKWRVNEGIADSTAFPYAGRSDQ